MSDGHAVGVKAQFDAEGRLLPPVTTGEERCISCGEPAAFAVYHAGEWWTFRCAGHQGDAPSAEQYAKEHANE